MSLNRVILIGRLTRDPESRTTNTGKEACEFSIAVDKRIKRDDQPNADFFRIKAWDRTANFVSQYLSKGRLVAVDGRIEQRQFTDKDGNKREVFEIVADNVQGLDRAPDDGGQTGNGRQNAGTGTRGSGTATGARAPSADEYDPFADE